MSLTAFGFAAVGTMFATYWLEDRSAWFVLAFAGACAASAVYGLLSGVAPFAVVESLWAVVAVFRFRKRRAAAGGS
ncbi:MAG TPA: hypothetical protein VEZ14_00895 [Dehalococcoidia bacterium]|nr:hypothetical protein [Dehalococcoidia bacterium]